MAEVERIMGTAIGIDVRGDGVPAPAIDAAFALLRDVDARFSPYLPDSEVSRLIRGELAEEDVAPDLRAVLGLCEDLRRTSDGAFDIRRHRPDGRPDPTGLVKGWAIEEASLVLDAAGATDYTINGGGDLVTRGAAGAGPALEDRDPPPVARRQGRGACSRSATGRSPPPAATSAAITSSTHGRAGHRTSSLSLTVVGPSLTYADAYATIGFVLGLDGLAWVDAHDGYGAYAITWTAGRSGPRWSTTSWRPEPSDLRQDLARIEDPERIEGVLDRPHHRDRAVAPLEGQVVAPGDADPVLGGDRPSEGDGSAVKRVRRAVELRLAVGVVAVQDDVRVEVAVADVAEGRDHEALLRADALDRGQELRDAAAWHADVLHPGDAQALHRVERHPARLAQPVGLLGIGRDDGRAGTGRLAGPGGGLERQAGGDPRQVGLDHQHRGGIAVEPELVGVVDRPIVVRSMSSSVHGSTPASDSADTARPAASRLGKNAMRVCFGVASDGAGASPR